MKRIKQTNQKHTHQKKKNAHNVLEDTLSAFMNDK